jgi:quercetin dioxygenase-like cupin family protein
MVIDLPRVSDDERRSIFELGFEFPKTVRTSVLLVSGDGAPLGNHYHRDQTEYFILVAGECVLTVQAVDVPGSMPRSYPIPAPCIVVMPPGVAHRFVFADGGTLVCMSDRAFDQADIIPHQFE